MMYIHYCANCQRIHMLNGHKQACPKCSQPLAELKIDYLSYASLDMEEREAFKAQCADPEGLEQLKTTYRMFKYSKWYRNLHRNHSAEPSCLADTGSEDGEESSGAGF